MMLDVEMIPEIQELMPDDIATRLMFFCNSLDGEILPLLCAPWRQQHPHLGQGPELLIALLVDGVLLQVERLEAAQARHHRLHIQLGDIVLPEL